MRVTQQIDALDIMGVNSASYLILPKILGLMTMIPLLVTFSIFAGVIGYSVQRGLQVSLMLPIWNMDSNIVS